jgi:hypothetical protein
MSDDVAMAKFYRIPEVSTTTSDLDGGHMRAFTKELKARHSMPTWTLACTALYANMNAHMLHTTHNKHWTHTRTNINTGTWFKGRENAIKETERKSGCILKFCGLHPIPLFIIIILCTSQLLFWWLNFILLFISVPKEHKYLKKIKKDKSFINFFYTLRFIIVSDKLLYQYFVNTKEMIR